MRAHRVKIAHGDLRPSSPARIPAIAATAAASPTTAATAAAWNNADSTQPRVCLLQGIVSVSLAKFARNADSQDASHSATDWNPSASIGSSQLLSDEHLLVPKLLTLSEALQFRNVSASYIPGDNFVPGEFHELTCAPCNDLSTPYLRACVSV